MSGRIVLLTVALTGLLAPEARAARRDVGLGASYGLRRMDATLGLPAGTARVEGYVHAASLTVRPGVVAAYMDGSEPEGVSDDDGPRVPHPWVRLTLYGGGEAQASRGAWAGARARGFELDGGAEFGISDTPLSWAVDLRVARRAFELDRETVPVWSWLNLGIAINWRPANWAIVSVGARLDPAMLAIFGLFSSDPGIAAASQLAGDLVDGLDVGGFARAGLSHVYGPSGELFVVAEAAYQANFQRNCRMVLATTGVVAGVTF
jgi:hypothetical protein